MGSFTQDFDGKSMNCRVNSDAIIGMIQFLLSLPREPPIKSGQ